MVNITAKTMNKYRIWRGEFEAKTASQDTCVLHILS